MEKGRVTWAKEEWDGIEIWKLTLPPTVEDVYPS
jgi:hypothetical protein